ncbi:MAG: S8 family serine peptidase [Ectothiorhodospiraceae bacterium]|nr:S8 family serine peptidase [Ectothiorhodospiraceae bacterium]
MKKRVVVVRNKILSSKSAWLLMRLSSVFLLVLVLAACEQASTPQSSTKTNATRGQGTESLVLSCNDRCDAVAQQITALGGKVNVQYVNVDALAIEVPSNIVDQIKALAGVKGLGKDRLVTIPRPVTPMAITSESILGSAAISREGLGAFVGDKPANYNFNNRLTGATALHQEGQLGEGVIVAVIDTGVANSSALVPVIFGSVIGGESFVHGVDEPSATSIYNDPHGTMVATMIAGHGALKVLDTSPIVQSLLTHAPNSVLPLNSFASTIPVIGTAPAASIYAMKVFPAEGGGASASAVLAAMDRALTLKRNYDAGHAVEPISGTGLDGGEPYVYDSLNIQVVNLSLGGGTLIPGLELEDLMALEMLANGITVVVATGNEGPASLTGGSPGTSVAALSVGAANTAIHERVWLDVEVELGFGEAYRPSDATQIAEFSSRGPTADGRRGVDLVANGVGSLVQSSNGGFYMVSGTSFSAPTVAGAAALLIAAEPDASAVEIRSALIESANDELMEDSASIIDQGEGFIDIAAALEILEDGDADDDLPTLPERSEKPIKISKLIDELDIEPIEFEEDEDNDEGNDEGNSYSISVTLVPGEAEHVLVPTNAETASIMVSISDVQPQLPLNEQNVIFGDDVFITVVDAPTSFNDVLASDFIASDAQWEFDAPQYGYLRLAVMGDFTNAGAISATITITEKQKKPLNALVKQRIRDGQFDSYPLLVTAGTGSIQFELDWKGDWGRYPVNDLDLILIDPDGNLVFDGATLRVPEKVLITDPIPGNWTIIVDGFQLHGTNDQYIIRGIDGAGNPLQITSSIKP